MLDDRQAHSFGALNPRYVHASTQSTALSLARNLDSVKETRETTSSALSVCFVLHLDIISNTYGRTICCPVSFMRFSQYPILELYKPVCLNNRLF